MGGWVGGFMIMIYDHDENGNDDDGNDDDDDGDDSNDDSNDTDTGKQIGDRMV